MSTQEQQDLEKKALEQFMSGKSLFGKDGAFAPMLKSFIEKALEAEMEEHLDDDQRSNGNKRNGKGNFTVLLLIMSIFENNQEWFRLF